MVWSGAEGSANSYPGWWASSGAYFEPAPPKLPKHYTPPKTKTKTPPPRPPKPPPKTEWRWDHQDPVRRGEPGLDINHTTLGLRRSASQEEIRAAYLRKAKQMHPDKGGDPRDFIKIKRAYDCLVQGSAQRS